MSTEGIVYLIGSVISIVLALRFFYKTSDNDIKVGDLGFFFFISVGAALLSWVTVVARVIVWINNRYGDVVLIKRKKE